MSMGEKMSNKKIFITVGNSHSTVYLIKSFKSIGYEVFIGDMNKDAIGKHFADKFFILPAQKSKEYISSLLSIIEKEKIDILVPAGEQECLKIVKEKNKFLHLGCTPIVTNIETLEISVDKADSYDFLVKNTDIPFMKYHTINSFKDLEIGLKKLKECKALAIKPSQGSGSRGFTILTKEVTNAEEYFNSKSSFGRMSIKDLKNLLKNSPSIPKLILMEMLDGVHYDSNMICKNGEVLFQSIRTREEAKVGTITKATIVDNQEIYDINKRIAKALSVDGYICTQYIGNKLIEINPRWSTSLNTDTINEYVMAIDLALGKNIKITDKEKVEYLNTKFLRYFDVLVYKD